MDAVDEAQIARVQGAVDAALGDTVVSSCLHGSAVLGGLRPTSDIDVLVVTDSVPARDVRADLVSLLLGVSGRRAATPGRPVEVTVVDRAALHPWSHPTVVAFQYGEWLRGEYEAGEVPSPEVSPDLTILLDTARRHGLALRGSAPSEILPVVSPEDLVAASLHGVPGLLDDLDGDERNVLLTIARTRATVDLGEVVTKDAAAVHVAAALPPELRRFLADARDDYLGVVTHAWDQRTDEVRACVDHLLAGLDT